MAIKSKKVKKFLYIVMFFLCILTFLMAVVSLIGASTLNSLAHYVDSYFWSSNEYISMEDYVNNASPLLNLGIDNIEDQIKFWTAMAIMSAILSLMSLIYLVAAVGVKDEYGKIQLSRFDMVFGEFQLIAISVIFFLGGGTFFVYVEDVMLVIYRYNQASTNFDMSIEIMATALVGLIAASLGLALILSNAKKVKANHWLDNTMVGWLFIKLYREIYKGGSYMRRVMLAAVLICIMSATIVLAPVALILILVYLPKMVHQYEAIRKGVAEVNDGNLQYKIPIEGKCELNELAEGINEMTDSINIAVQNELRIQRMKTDLISNVSHDLRTPLTSIVTYVELLKQENLDPQQQREYLEILSQKTERLCQLTDDLFEAAKASSGTMPVEMGAVDFLSLLNQAMGEMNERIENSSLEFVINHPEERYFVSADGRLLWRVISNLLSNVLKYSQENTRVYVDFYRESNLVTMEMKNISKQSLNVDPDILMERFRRGDASRTIEGSGLGLTIAKDLMKLMGGLIDITIDGDLFKVRLGLVETEPPAEVLEFMKLQGMAALEADEDGDIEREAEAER